MSEEESSLVQENELEQTSDRSISHFDMQPGYADPYRQKPVDAQKTEFKTKLNVQMFQPQNCNQQQEEKLKQHQTVREFNRIEYQEFVQKGQPCQPSQQQQMTSGPQNLASSQNEENDSLLASSGIEERSQMQQTVIGQPSDRVISNCDIQLEYADPNRQKSIDAQKTEFHTKLNVQMFQPQYCNQQQEENVKQQPNKREFSRIGDQAPYMNPAIVEDHPVLSVPQRYFADSTNVTSQTFPNPEFVQKGQPCQPSQQQQMTSGPQNLASSQNEENDSLLASSGIEERSQMQQTVIGQPNDRAISNFDMPSSAGIHSFDKLLDKPFNKEKRYRSLAKKAKLDLKHSVCFDKAAAATTIHITESTRASTKSTTTSKSKPRATTTVIPPTDEKLNVPVPSTSTEHIQHEPLLKEGFLDSVERYFYLLKQEKRIEIFSGFGRLLAMPQYCTEKQLLHKQNNVLIERRFCSFKDEKHWLHWCSCNHRYVDELSSLSYNLNISYNDIQTQFADCLHITVSKKIFATFDNVNNLQPLEEMELLQDMDHNYTVNDDISYTLNSNQTIVCSGPRERFYGLVDLKPKIRCHSCRQPYCSHVRIGKAVNPASLFEEDPPPSCDIGYHRKMISKNPISFPPRYEEALKELTKADFNEKLYPPAEGSCSCGEVLLKESPVANGWVDYQRAAIITNSYLGYASVYYRKCSNHLCDCITLFDGQSHGFLNCGTFLVGYDVLIEYMYSFLHGRRPLFTFYQTFVDVHKAYGNHSIKEVFSYDKLRHAWISFLKLLDLDFQSGYQCKSCGDNPKTIICDGTTLSFQRRMWSWAEPEDDQSECLDLSRSKFSERLFISEPSARKSLLQDLKNGVITCVCNASWWADRPMFKRVLRIIESDPQSMPIYKDLLKSLASASPITSMLLPTKQVECLVLSLYTCQDPRENPSMWKTLHEEVPLFYEVMSNGADIRAIQDLLMEVWNCCVNSIKLCMPYPMCPPKEKESEMGFFPSIPIMRNRGKFVMDKKTIKKEDGECKKKAAGHPSLLPGIFTIFCEHGICYGFEVMASHESPNIPFTVLKTRFNKAPQYVIYDNSCKLHAYAMSRDPLHFIETKFLVDRLHWDNHTGCSMAYQMDRYPQMTGVNSQINEQANAGLKRIKAQLSYMTANNFLSHCAFYLWYKNFLLSS